MLTRLALRDEPVASIAANQRMPQKTGIAMLDTSVPGVFAASDGAISVYLVHRYLATV